MIQCDPRVFAKCPTHQFCGVSAQDATFSEGSECDKFNQRVLSRPMTRADHIRVMSDEELAAFWSSSADCFCQNKPECTAALDSDSSIPDQWCIACAHKWLQEPVKEAQP